MGCVVAMDLVIGFYNRRFKTTFAHLVQEAEASRGAPFEYQAGALSAAADEETGGAASKAKSSNAFDVLDALDEELWQMEKSGRLEIPGPKLPSFPEDPAGSSSFDNPVGPQQAYTRDRTTSELELRGAGGKTDAVPRHSISARTAASMGMSMDTHASVTLANDLRRSITQSEDPSLLPASR